MQKKLTTQKLHSIIRGGINKKCSKYSVSQKINRTSYSLYTRMRGIYGIMSGQFINEIAEALTRAGIVFDDLGIDRGWIKVKIKQENSI